MKTEKITKRRHPAFGIWADRLSEVDSGEVAKKLRKKLESRTDGFVIIQRKHYTTPGGFRIFRDVRNAISREKQIKGGSRAKKNRINLME